LSALSAKHRRTRSGRPSLVRGGLTERTGVPTPFPVADLELRLERHVVVEEFRRVVMATLSDLDDQRIRKVRGDDTRPCDRFGDMHARGDGSTYQLVDDPVLDLAILVSDNCEASP